MSDALTGISSPVTRDRRLFAGLGEFLVVGGLTPLLFALSWLMRKSLSLDTAELIVGFTMFHAAFVINDPHFSVTYLLFYKDLRARAFGNAFIPRQRLRYLVAGFVMPALLGVWAIYGLATKSAVVLGWLFQLMFLLVGWHYVKQGFGVMVVLAARRGVTFLPRERLSILAHCFAGWAYAWSTKPNAGVEVEEKGVVFTKLPYPPGLERASLIVLIITLGVMLVLLALKWRREARFPLLTPLTALLVSIWSWSIFSGIDPLVRYVIPALHSVQYLYMVWLLKTNEARDPKDDDPPWVVASTRSRLALLAASALGLGWLLFHGAPTLLDDILVTRKDRLSDLGATPYFASLYAVVNLHHYFMDHVIWRRENPLTRYLRVTDPSTLKYLQKRTVLSEPSTRRRDHDRAGHGGVPLHLVVLLSRTSGRRDFAWNRHDWRRGNPPWLPSPFVDFSFDPARRTVVASCDDEEGWKGQQRAASCGIEGLSAHAGGSSLRC